MFIDDYLLSPEARAPRPQTSCDNCKDWGCTVSDEDSVRCPKCNRPTYPNLGVNLPAGCAWSYAGTIAIRMMRRNQHQQDLDELVTSTLHSCQNKK